MNLLVNSYDHDNNYSGGWIDTSNRRYMMWQLAGNSLAVDGSVVIAGAAVADMDANDTCQIKFTVPNSGAAQVDVAADSFWSGYLAC